MALKATVFKVEINIADMCRHHYQDYNLTVARHPSETDLRMFARLLAFSLIAQDGLLFTKGLSTDDEPELWQKDDTGRILTWVELGQPDEKRIKKACSQAEQVYIINYQARSSQVWRAQGSTKHTGFKNLHIIELEESPLAALAEQVSRQISMQINIDEDELWVTCGETSLAVPYIRHQG
jgi:uncharacterized protein YaeQ